MNDSGSPCSSHTSGCALSAGELALKRGRTKEEARCLLFVQVAPGSHRAFEASATAGDIGAAAFSGAAGINPGQGRWGWGWGGAEGVEVEVHLCECVCALEPARGSRLACPCRGHA